MAKKRKSIKRKVRRAKPGPRAGSKYQSAEQIKLALIDATENLLSEGIVVASLSLRQITQRAGVDKMYVNRYFGDLDGLLLAVIQNLLATRMRSLISSDVFTLGRADATVIHAFEIYVHLARNQQLEPQLRQLAAAVLAVYKGQLREVFGLDDAAAMREAVIGLVWLVGYLSVGHLLPIAPSEIDDLMANRRSQLGKRSH